MRDHGSALARVNAAPATLRFPLVPRHGSRSPTTLPLESEYAKTLPRSADDVSSRVFQPGLQRKGTDTTPNIILNEFFTRRAVPLRKLLATTDMYATFNHDDDHYHLVRVRKRG